MQTNLGFQTEVGADGAPLAARRYPPVVVIALIIGLLPLANGLLFRTYYFPFRPAVLNPLFELEFLYLFAEFCLILWARARGMAFKTEFLKLNQLTRYALLAFLSLFWISSVAFAPAPIYSAIRAFYWLVHIGCAFALGYLITAVRPVQLQRSVEIVAAGFVAISVVLGIHFYFAPFSHHAVEKGFDWTSIAPGYLSIRQFGMVSGFVLTAWIATILSGKKVGGSALGAFAVTAILFGIMFWTGTRSAMLAVAVAIPTVVIFGRKLPPKFAIVSVMFAAVIGAALSTIWIPPGGSYGILTPSKFAIVGSPDISSGRLDLWRYGLEMLRESPIFGWGEGSYFQLLAMAGKGFHLQPHNFVIQFLMSWGILAGGIALIMMAKALLRLHLCLHRAYLMMIPLAALDSILVMAMLDGALFTLRTILPAIFFWILAEKISADADTAPA
ncbi:MAG: O-antigen ligase family protein [Sphingorhabdus sp.]